MSKLRSRFVVGWLLIQVAWGGTAASGVTLDELLLSESALSDLLTTSDAAAQDMFGISVALNGGRAVVGANGVTGEAGSAQGAAYVFVHDEGVWTLEAELVASDGAAGDRFGISVAMEGETIVVGAFLAGGSAGNFQGAAYVFVLDEGVWSEQAKLVASDPMLNDRFGVSVGIDGDTAAIGSYLHNGPGGTNQGAVYVFVRDGTNWNQQARLRASDGAANDRLGHAVAIRGDTVVAGADGADGPAGLNQGAAYVFVRNGTDWSQQAKLTPSDAAAGDHFGVSVALNGHTALVGAERADGTAGADQGAAYVFLRDGATWSQQSKLVAADAAAGDRFGISVSLDGDMAAVGAFLADGPAGADQGTAHVFVRDNGAWTEEITLTVPDGQPGSQLGYSAVVSGDRVLVGAPAQDGLAGADQGAAYLFRWDEAEWCREADLNLFDAGDLSAGDEFGVAVAIDGNTVVVGAHQDSGPEGLAQGSAHVFVSEGSGWVSQAKLTASDAAAGDGFGVSVAISGDTAVVGAHLHNASSGFAQGAAYVFIRNGTEWAEQAKLVAPDAAAGDRFGVSVAIDGDTAVIGAYLADGTAGGDTGAAYVFVREADVWTYQAKLTAGDAAANDQLGYAVAVSGDTAVAGAVGKSGPAGTARGAAYVFVRDGAAWSEQDKLLGSDTAAFDIFGISVDISGDTVAVGAFRHDEAAGVDQGAAYVFVREGETWSEQAKLLDSEAAAGDRFGISVAVRGDVAAVGSYFKTGSQGAQEGAAVVFVRSGTNWSEAQRLTASDAAAGDRFGYAVALSEPVLYRPAAVVVGANLADGEAGLSQGAAYVYGFFTDCNDNGIPDADEPDSDGDGVIDACDLCPGTVPGSPVDADGCPPLIPGDFDRNGAVDVSDFSLFAPCITGPTILYDPQDLPPGCTLVPDQDGFIPADFDRDGDVDQEDFATFQRCYSGFEVPGDPDCAD